MHFAQQLKVGENDSCARLTCVLKLAGKQRGFPHLARPLHEDDAVSAQDSLPELLVCRALNVEGGT